MPGGVGAVILRTRRPFLTAAPQPIQEMKPQSETPKILRSSAIGVAGFALLYLLFLALYLRFPYLRPGDNLVADMKQLNLTGS